jgi:hypothetical protein
MTSQEDWSWSGTRAVKSTSYVAIWRPESPLGGPLIKLQGPVPRGSAVAPWPTHASHRMEAAPQRRHAAYGGFAKQFAQAGPGPCFLDSVSGSPRVAKGAGLVRELRGRGPTFCVCPSAIECRQALHMSHSNRTAEPLASHTYYTVHGECTPKREHGEPGDDAASGISSTSMLGLTRMAGLLQG